MCTVFCSAVVLILCSWSSVSATWVATQPNAYIDTVLRTALPYDSQTSQLDPLPLFDFKTMYRDHVPLVGGVKVQVNYTGGRLLGLSEVHRNGDCSGPLYAFNAAFLNCTLAFDNLRIEYDGSLKYGKLPKVSVKARANLGPTLLFVDIVSYPNSPVPLLRFFRFLQVGTVETEHTGLGPLNKKMKVLEDNFRGRAWSMFFNAIAQQFQFAFSRAVASVPWY